MEASSIHVEQSAHLPGFLQLARDSMLKGRPVVGNIRATLEEGMAKAACVSFFIAGKIEVASKQFPGMFRVGVAARARHLRTGQVFFER
jgi:hypothetical protein